jgi:pilus assembly protein FimV
VDFLEVSVVRNLTKTIAAVSILAPASVYPLGIGDIKLHSALNQKLNAEIALILSGNESASNIKVKLAPPEKFDEAGIPWSYFLSKIQFQPIVRPDGSVVVQLSSNEALSEPFLDFLLEVSWPQGSLYREFTILVDPPATYTQTVIPVATEAVATEHKNFSAPSIKPAPVDNYSIDNGMDNISEYGPTNGSDSLWKVAEKVNSDPNVSVEQMMIALYEANPKAFYKDNVNALMAGQKLKVPEQQVILKLSRKQARSEFYRQVKEWEGRPEAKPVVDDAVTPQATADASTGQLKLIAPSKTEVTGNVEVVPGGSATAPNIETTESTNQDGGGDSSLSRENQDLKARLEKLEQQMAIMQKMLVLRDEQLTALQSGQAKITTLPSHSEQEASTSHIDQTQKQTPNQSVVATKLGQRPTESAAPQVNPAPSAQVKDEKQQVKPDVKQQPVVSAALKKQPQNKKNQETKQESVSGLNVYNLIVGLIGGGLLGLLGWLWWRKRKVEEEQNSESMFAASSQILLPDTDQEIAINDDSSSYDVGTVGESSFLSEFTPSDFDAFETDQNEVDPISEADVYLAYGRYQQAEELMLQAIQDQPDRDECKLKLLEIFYANENKESFSTYANELAKAGKKDDAEFWAKVVEMGNEIIPDSALFSTGTIEATAGSHTGKDAEPTISEEENIESIQETDDNAIDFDFSSTADEINNDETISLEPNIDLSQTGDIAESLEDMAQSSAENEFEFDLSLFDAEQPGSDREDELSSEVTLNERLAFEVEPLDDEHQNSMETSELTALSESLEEDAQEKNDEQRDLESESSPESGGGQSLDLDESSLGIEAEDVSISADLTAGSESLDFDFSTADDKQKDEENIDLEIETENLESLGVDESSLGMEAEDVSISADMTAGSESLDFDFSAADEKQKDEENIDLEIDTENLESLDVDGGSLGVEAQDVSISADLTAGSETLDFEFSAAEAKETRDEFDFNFDLDSSQANSNEDATESVDIIQDQHQVSDLTDMDECETKIDMAKAYIDMGDEEAAKSMVEEVLKKGNDIQKKEAKEIIEKL